MSLNNASVQGRLIADPELRTTASNVPVCSFRVAWSEKYKETETKLFLNCVAWRATGEMVSKYFSKGKEIIVEGKLSTREWEDREGNKRSTVELTVDKVHFCGPKSDGDSSSNYSAPAPSAGYAAAPDADGFAELADDGELPF